MALQHLGLSISTCTDSSGHLPNSPSASRENRLVCRQPAASGSLHLFYWPTVCLASLRSAPWSLLGSSFCSWLQDHHSKRYLFWSMNDSVFRVGGAWIPAEDLQRRYHLIHWLTNFLSQKWWWVSVCSPGQLTDNLPRHTQRWLVAHTS